jgi:CheY-like chemotaxis protein
MSVFVSYNSKIEDFAELVKMKLEKEGINVWKDTIQIAAGTEWRNEIDQGLINCDVIVVLLNDIACKSSYVTYEWAFALGSGKHIIPILTEDCEVHPRIEVIQYLNFKNGQRPWDKLVDRIKKLKSSAQKLKVSDLTVEELEKLIEGSRSLAKETAKSEGRQVTDDEVAGFANKIVSAKTLFETTSEIPNTILWVDDRPDNNVYEREALSLIGFKFDLALSTTEGLKLLKKNKYVAVISDMGRVEGPKEGYILLKEVRKFDREIPFFIYAGSNLPEHKKEALEKGAQGSTNLSFELIDLITAYVKPVKG